MQCPLCIDSVLEPHLHGGVEIDVCPICKGVWLDRGELQKLADADDDPRRSGDRRERSGKERDRKDRDRDRDDRDRSKKKDKKRRKSLGERLGDVLDDVLDFD